MTSMGVLFFLILIVLAAILGDHYTRLKKIGWMPQPDPNAREKSWLDPVGSALGELGRADGPYKLIAALLGGIGTALEVVFKPIGAVLGLASGAKGN